MSCLIVRSSTAKGEKGRRKRETFFLAGRIEYPRGRKAQESKWSYPELILQGANKGHGCFDGRKPLRRRTEAERSLWKARERRGREDNFRSIIGTE
jgi:hypothetical protein